MDYKSPIQIYTHGPSFKEMEDGIMRAIIRCGVQIDKDELIRALAYDRDQYRDGYEAAEKKYKRPEGEWLFKKQTNDNRITGQCSNCKERSRINNYCPCCGADMRGEKK